MIRNATAEDVNAVVWNLRGTDKREIRALTGMHPEDAIATLGASPCIAFTVMYEGRPAAIFGATQTQPGVAVMHRFSTADWSKVVKEAIRFGRREFLPRIWGLWGNAKIDRIEAVTMDDPEQTAWLRLFGAKPVETFERNGLPFVRFALDRPS